MLPGLLRILGKTKIIGPRKKLLRTVHPAGRQQFLGTNNSQIVFGMIPDEILSAIPPG